MMLQNVFSFRKKKERQDRWLVGIPVRFLLCFESPEHQDCAGSWQRGILENVSRSGLKLTVTPVFDKDLMRKIDQIKTFLRIELLIPSEDIPSSFHAEVKRVSADMTAFPALSQVGAVFLDMAIEDKVRLSRFLNQSQRRSLVAKQHEGGAE